MINETTTTEVPTPTEETTPLTLESVKGTLTTVSADFLKNLQADIINEEQEAMNDFVKGAYRLSLEKQREMEQLKKEVNALNVAITEASKGNFDNLGKIKIPARFFKESTLRQHGKSFISGSEEIRFLDLYVSDSEE